MHGVLASLRELHVKDSRSMVVLVSVDTEGESLHKRIGRESWIRQPILKLFSSLFSALRTHIPGYCVNVSAASHSSSVSRSPDSKCLRRERASRIWKRGMNSPSDLRNGSAGMATAFLRNSATRRNERDASS